MQMSPSAAIINLIAVMPQSGLKKAVLVAAGGGEARARRRGGQRSHGHMSPPLQPASVLASPHSAETNHIRIHCVELFNFDM